MDVSEPVGSGSDFLGYRIEELLGRGGMGVVYRAYDLRLKRPVALKLVAPALARDERFRERFARESELVMSLEHPNVVPIYDAGDIDDCVYLAMRLVDGRDLGSLLRAEGALEPLRAIAICSQIAAALDAAHARGLVHRDVKPSNVLLDASEHVYLADFGLTRRLDDEWIDPGLDRSIGTPAYLAPEQLACGPVTSSVDVYSLGCVLYECLTGKAVFPRSSRLAVAWAHLEDEPPKPSLQRLELPQAVDAVIAQAMAKEPEQRHPNCGALVDAAGEALGLGTPRAAGRRRTLLLAGGVAIAIAVAAAVIATTLAHGAPKTVTPPPRSDANTLVRINPWTKKITARVRNVGLEPMVAAGSGRYVWVYGEKGGTIAEVDTRTNRVVKMTVGSSNPPAECCGLFSGPVLAADASGAWFVSGGLVGEPQLVHVPVNVKGRRQRYPLPVTPTGVAVGDGFVWIVGRTSREDEVLRFDPAHGRVTGRSRLPASARIDSIAFGYGWVWASSSARATLYRIDPNFRRRTRRVKVAHSRAARPEIFTGTVLVRVKGGGGRQLFIDPATLTQDGPSYVTDDPSNEEQVGGFHLSWWYDWYTGDVYWEKISNAPEIPHEIRVTSSPTLDGPCLTSITTAYRSIWVTVAPEPGDYHFACRV
jgi:Protein kinase domain